MSLIEILVAIVLIGLVVTAILTTLTTTTTASGIDRDHAIAFTWLQAASDEVYRETRVPCTAGQAAAIAAYDIAAKSVPRPDRWAAEPSATIAVTNVEYLGRPDPNADFDWDASYCFEGGIYADSPLYTQRVTIEARSPDGRIVKTLQMVKSEG
jgi:type II secretory pathway pseudopilin PulG